MSRKVYCLMLLLFLLSTGMTAGIDRNMRFTHLTNNEGLPCNTVYAICQDYKDFIWIGTKNGLCRYDGRTVSDYDIEIVGGRRLLNGQILQIFEDSKRRLWVVAQKGINLYDREKDRFIAVPADSTFVYRKTICEDKEGHIYVAGSGVVVYNEERHHFETLFSRQMEGLSGNITSMSVDAENRLWLGKAVNGLIRIDRKSGETIHYRRDPADMNSLISDRILGLYTDQQGFVWIGTLNRGVCRFDPATGKFEKPEAFPAILVRAFEEDSRGNVWMGTEEGLYIYSPQTGLLTNYKQNYNDRYSLNDNALYAIFRDREDNMLIGTYFGGVNIFLNTFRQLFHYDYGYTDRHLSGKAVRQIIGDRKDNLLIATEDGGLNYYNRTTDSFLHVKPEPGRNSLSYHNVHSLLIDSSGCLWIGTFQGGLNRYDPVSGRFTHYSVQNHPGLIVDNVFSLLEDRRGKIWVGTTAGLTVFDPKREEFQRFSVDVIGLAGIDHLCEDSSGNIWIATRSKGVFCYNETTDSLLNYSKELPDNFVNYILEDSRGMIWIATHEGGLSCYNRQEDSFTTLSVSDGLPSNTIFAIVESDAGQLWISTNNGLSCLDTEDYTFTNYSISEGLPNKQFNYNSAYKTSDGLLFFGTINGMIAFRPESLQTMGTVAEVKFQSLTVLGKVIRPGDESGLLQQNIDEVSEIRLSHEEAKSVTLNFTVPSINHPNSTFFALKFDGERDWSYLGIQHHVTYANLPPGEYTLNIKAVFNNRWSGDEPVRRLKLIVEPPFWQSPMAYLIYMGLLSLLFLLFYLFLRRRQEEKRLILAERLEKEKIQELNALKLSFFTNISHELRTPLSLILTPVQSFLERNLFAPEIKPRMKQVADNAQRMNNLIDELILFSKVEMKQEKIRLKRGDLLRFVETIGESFESLAEDKELEYELCVDSEEKEVWFAPLMVEKIVCNLLSNAFKYTEAGSVSLRAFIDEKDDFSYLNLIVRDTGIGIPIDKKQAIFENYYQVNEDARGEKKGFGIGLALTRELVELHKGTIRVESEPDKGSEFIVCINVSAPAFDPEEIAGQAMASTFDEKYAEQTEEQDVGLQQALEEENSKPYQLLLIEDNRELLTMYQELFRDSYRVLMAADAEEGLRIAKEQLPDLILSDVMMPGMSGLELAMRLKSMIETCHIPLVLLTARTGEQAQMEGYDSGADLYVEKPFHPALLYRQIANLIATKENQRRQYRANEIDIVEISANEKDKKLIANVEKAVLRHLDDSSFSVNDLLKELGIGRTLLHVKLKSMVGMSTTEFINKIRLTESIKLLKAGKNISEAAYATGFSSPNYYSRCFKKLFGVPPREMTNEKGDTPPGSAE
ncbi:response regulator [Parabacteroides sp. OttesenSCG-928-N08]|nr:response regulator [Parabacteroides sp. OttesenSCG-928-N08]